MEEISMSKQVLMMKYHPAKKEVEFRRFQDRKEVAIRSDSILRTKYMNKKGNFVLQDYGNEFFDDIADAFDGLEVVDIQVTTTKMDFADFKEMAEYYNEDGKCKINATLIAELPDMKQAFQEAIKCGKTAIAQLQYHDEQLFNFYMKKENRVVNVNAENYRKQIQEEISNIKEKIASMTDNTVNLCFTGVYSSGKSALINAILGYKILPESISSETAKMFRISSPQKGECVKICFDLETVPTELIWNSDSKMFDISMGPNESDERKLIQEKINEGKNEEWPQYQQIREILGVINKLSLASTEIRVYFPVSLDNDMMQFTIYDTPGTDSNYKEHQQVLLNALKEQRQSILIFVATPDKLEGSGNNVLLQYLKETELKDSKTSIDLGRSLFVINKADSVDYEDLDTLRAKKIQCDESFSIKLSDKKLFFTAAKYAYSAKAMLNNIPTLQDERNVKKGNRDFSEDENEFRYKLDSCAASQIATKRLKDKCDEAVKQAGEDIAKKLLVTTGLYALESEICEYGEKYASAVKAFAIIDSVDKALAKLTNQTRSLLDSNEQGIQQIQTNINELRKTITDSIESECKKRIPYDSAALPKEVLERLGLDPISVDNAFSNVHNEIDAELSKHSHFFNENKIKPLDKADKIAIKDIFIKNTLSMKLQFVQERENLLTEQRDDFINSVKYAISQNGNIRESAKKVIADIPKPCINPVTITQEKISDLYEKCMKESSFLWMKKKYLDRNEFEKELEKNFTTPFRQSCNLFKSEYYDTLCDILEQVKGKFETNLEQYSVNMGAMLQNRDAMMRLGAVIEEAAQSLAKCEETLNNSIWRELKDD